MRTHLFTEKEICSWMQVHLKTHGVWSLAILTIGTYLYFCDFHFSYSRTMHNWHFLIDSVLHRLKSPCMDCMRWKRNQVRPLCWGSFTNSSVYEEEIVINRTHCAALSKLIFINRPHSFHLECKFININSNKITRFYLSFSFSMS